jgi:NAD(P)-dependent dehydrogenase (short-subunit alcohol dehydrogenase family)
MLKNILITGASSGFGRDTAETLAQAGHQVFASMRDVADRNRPHAEALQAKGIHVVELDVTDDTSVERGVTSVLEQAGRLDVLVNNAGIPIAQLVEQPNGTRPARLVVGQSFGADIINAQAVSIQAQLIEGLGLGKLAELQTGSAVA